ncbi:hypothetical protein ACFQBQ_07940 [Granulicella cerasi]|uniref:Uncharacterized protein n=1 Tax=Granulicella cerasi TaxID=741063 RepID=A0ABW1ZAF8_9BACT|nr:hypothetical protein [Granulicella cerasi]
MFLLSGAAALTAAPIHGLSSSRTSHSGDVIDLIPKTPSRAPNYWCTWAVQNYMHGQHASSLSIRDLEGDAGSRLAHDALNEHVLLGPHGWARDFFPRVREDLYLLLDDGWESGGTATFELDEQKFPSYRGSTSERLRKLNHSVRKAGWRGLALWCRNTPGGLKDERLERLSADAGIGYWKVDIGDPTFNLIQTRNANHLPLRFEHVHGESPLNGDWQRTGRFGSQPSGSKRQQILAHTDIYRTYDVTSMLSLPTTLDRLAEMLKGAQSRSEIRALLNVEDEAYVAAVMGCTMGIMRHPLSGLRPDTDPDLFFNGPRKTKQRMDEVARAIRWQRIAPPFAAGRTTFTASEEILTDDWLFERGQTWQNDVIGKVAYQGAPACIARGIALPRVQAGGEKPFVFAARFPNGAVAIGIQERTHRDNGWFMPSASVTFNVGDAQGPFGIFGSCKSLRLVFAQSLAGKRIFVQDLLTEVGQDVTAKFDIKSNELQLTESDMRMFGHSAGSPGDISSPGFVFAIR